MRKTKNFYTSISKQFLKISRCYHDAAKLKGLIDVFSNFSKNICRMKMIRLDLKNMMSGHCNARSLVDFGPFLTILASFEKKVYFCLMSL